MAFGWSLYHASQVGSGSGGLGSRVGSGVENSEEGYSEVSIGKVSLLGMPRDC